MFSSFGSSRGFALVSVVWIVLLLALLAAGLMHLLLVSKRTVNAQAEDTQYRYIAESAVDIFMSGFFYNADEQTYQDASFKLFGHDVSVVVSFEGGKVNLNQAGYPLLSALFASKGINTETATNLASAIIDWRDADDIPVAGGAEFEAYEAGGLSYRPRNGAFETVGEMRHVFGMTDDVFQCVLPYVTVYSLNGNVDIPRAGAGVRDILVWAYENEWTNEAWPEPSDPIFSESSNTVNDIGGQALTLTISVGESRVRIYEQKVRFKSLSNRFDYARLTPLVQVGWDSQKECN